MIGHISEILQCIAILLLAINTIRIGKRLYEVEQELMELRQEQQQLQRWLR